MKRLRINQITRAILTTSLVWLTMCCTLQAGEFVSRSYESPKGSSKYAVYLPDGFSKQDSWPVMLWLHGAGERGRDGQLQTQVGLGQILRLDEYDVPYVVVFPQSQDKHAPILSGWDVETADGGTALKILDEAIEEFQLNRQQQVLMGWSMGGFGAVELALHAPQRWKSVVVLAGGDRQSDYSKAKDIPFWLFHGERDKIVPPQQTENLAEKLRDAGAEVRVTLLEETDHNLWRDVCRWEGLYEWMKAPETAVPYSAPEPLPEDSPLLDASAEFISALEIPSVGYIRLGNTMLEAVSASIPEKIPDDVLEGTLANIWDRTQAAGRAFNVRFSRISYEGDVARVYVGAYGKDRLTLQLALSNVNLVIGRTDVSGSGKSAVAGPIRIVIGHREPVWLSVAVEPTVENRRLRFKLISTRFQIPRNNWYVTTPRILGTRGLGMTPERVREGLVSGLYSSRRRIEDQVQSLVPQLIKQLESNLDVIRSTEQLNSAWPLPVYQPRIRIWPQEVLTDPEGVTIRVGMSVAAYFPSQYQGEPRTSRIGQLSSSEFPTITDLQVGVSSDVLTPLTSQLIAEDVAHIHLEDVPNTPFKKLYQQQVMREVFSDLKKLGPGFKVRHEFRLTHPLSIAPPPLKAPRPGDDRPSQNVDGVELNLSLQTARLITTFQTAEDQPWQPLAEFEFSVTQGVQVDVDASKNSSRSANIGWSDETMIQAQLVSSHDPGDVNTNLFVAEFRKGWRRWIQNQKSRKIDVPDLDFGKSKLRLSAAGWGFRQGFVRFSPPGIRISNQSDRPLRYQIQTGISDWSETYTLPPNEEHVFDGAQSFQFREIDSETGTAQQTMTLPAGSVSAYKSTDQSMAPSLNLVE
ncbi:MAG: dienelactone hydrolase family protein [Planctomycetaceae bacterium]|nr:dienelactone hydrolase family protein [Planctomycetaceae bacterium]